MYETRLCTAIIPTLSIFDRRHDAQRQTATTPSDSCMSCTNHLRIAIMRGLRIVGKRRHTKKARHVESMQELGLKAQTLSTASATYQGFTTQQDVCPARRSCFQLCGCSRPCWLDIYNPWGLSEPGATASPRVSLQNS